MKNTIRLLIMALVAVALFAAPTYAQTATTQTALSSAVTTTNGTTFSLVSASGFLASATGVNYFAYVDQELTSIRSVDSTNNTITVTRGVDGTASRHVSGSIVTFGVIGAVNRASGDTSGVFVKADPIGGCTRGTQGFTIVVNLSTHRYFNCNSTSGRWVKSDYTPGDGSSFQSVVNPGDAAYTATLLDRYIDYTSASVARTVTLPSVTNLYGKTLTISNFTSGTFQTITIASVNGQTINGSASITIDQGTGAGQANSITLISVGGFWRRLDRCGQTAC